ncbi:MAG: MBL fold metallo-hydrolase [Myxococcales bacterium]|nr:MBL fold metallo-hydrolase [Myxococcales bacterium]
MRVTFHGVRGSVATPGPATIRYGGNTVCVEVRTVDGSLIVLDLGTGVRELGKQLIRAPLPDPIHIFVTHAHWDHIIGAPFFAPLWRRDAHVVLHALSQRAHQRLSKNVLFDGEHFPVRAQDIPAHVERPPFVGSSVRIGSATVKQIQLNHPGGADGFRIDDADGSSVCYLTDNELAPPGPCTTSSDDLARFAASAGLIIHDSQYLPTDMPHKHGWGHSLVADVLALGQKAEARALALHHHDPDRDDDALDRIAADSAAWAREHAPGMKTLAAAEGTTLEIAP